MVMVRVILVFLGYSYRIYGFNLANDAKKILGIIFYPIRFRLFAEARLKERHVYIYIYPNVTSKERGISQRWSITKNI